MSVDSLRAVGQPLAAAPADVPPQKLAQHRELIQAVKALDAAELFGPDQELAFALDRETRRPLMRIIHRKTNQVILQVPPERVLRMAQNLSLLRPEK